MKKLNLPNYVKIVAIMTIVNVLILFVRNKIVGDSIFNFLLSNLFSGFLPLLFAFLIHRFYDKLSNFFFWIGTFLWFLFYPNSPYMISDLIHDSSDPKDAILPDLIVFDTLIIFSIALLSIFMGFISLKIMYNIFREKYSKKFAKIALTFTLVLSCLGFYMGRVLRAAAHAGNLYSWDFLLHPIKVFKEVWAALFPVGEHIYAYLMMILFGIVQFMLLLMMKDVGDFEADEIITKKSDNFPK